MFIVAKDKTKTFSQINDQYLLQLHEKQLNNWGPYKMLLHKRIKYSSAGIVKALSLLTASPFAFHIRMQIRAFDCPKLFFYRVFICF